MKRRSLSKVFAVAVLGLLLPAVAGAQDTGKVRQAMEAINKRFVDYILKGDIKGIGSLYLEDAVLQFQGAPSVVGRKNIEAYWASSLEGGVQAVEVRPERIFALAPDVAMQVGTYTMTLPGVSGAAPTVVKGKYGAVYQRRGGQWKVILDTGSE